MSPGLYGVPVAYCWWRRKETWEKRRKRSGTLGNSYWGRQADVCASCPRALHGVHALCHGFTTSPWSELHILSHCISYGDIFHLNWTSLHPFPWLAQQVWFHSEVVPESTKRRSFSMELAIWFTLCRCHIPLCLGSVWSYKSSQYDRETLLVTKQFGWC